MYIYLIKNGDLHKIGITRHLERRMRELKPDKIVCTVEQANAIELEKFLHRKFADKRLPQTEYFRLSKNEVNNAIIEMKNETRPQDMKWQDYLAEIWQGRIPQNMEWQDHLAAIAKGIVFAIVSLFIIAAIIYVLIQPSPRIKWRKATHSAHSVQASEPLDFYSVRSRFHFENAQLETKNKG